MPTIKLAETISNSWCVTAPPCPLRDAKLFSSIQDIGELLRFNNLQKQTINEPSPQFHHRRIKAGDVIYRQGQPFQALYIVRFGFLKTVLRNTEGNERVLSFPMKGNLLGFEGICGNHYGTEVISLTDGELIVIPFKQLLASACPELEHMIYVAISRAFIDEHAGISLSSTVKSEARVAHFLEELAKRYAALGYSPHEFSLPMTRRDIGCYLGLTLETVSRSLSTLASLGIISVRRRKIQILKPELLHLFQFSRLASQQKNGHCAISLTLPALNKIKPFLTLGL